MTMTWRTTDLARWGVGKGANLSELELDENFWDHDFRIVALEEMVSFATVSIDDFTVEGDQMTVIMTDYTTRGPYTLPVVLPNPRGEWLPATAYGVFDLVTVGGAVYVVAVAHTSQPTFDPGYQIGGEDVYGLMLEAATGTIPAGGPAGWYLTKSIAVDYAVTWVEPPVPAGGTTGQVLKKQSATDFDTDWDDLSFEDLAGVDLSGAAIGNTLIFNGTNWTPVTTIPTGGSIDYVLRKTSNDSYATSWSPFELSALGDVDTTINPPGFGDLLGHDGLTWVPVGPATAAEYRNNTGEKIVRVQTVWDAAAVVTLTDGVTITPDFAAGINFMVTLAGNRTLANPTNAKPGQSGIIVIIQDGTGNRTLSWGVNWKFAGGTDPVLTTSATHMDVLSYFVLTPTNILASLTKSYS